MTMKTLLLLTIPLLLFSCRPCRTLTRFEKTETIIHTRDVELSVTRPSIELHEASEIIVQGDSLIFEPSVLETEFCFSRVFLSGLSVQHRLHQKPVQIDTVVVVQEKETTTTIEVPVEVNVLRWWQVMFIRVGQVALVILAGYVAIRFGLSGGL